MSTKTDLSERVQINFTGGQEFQLAYHEEGLRRGYRFNLSESLPSKPPKAGDFEVILFWNRTGSRGAVFAVVEHPQTGALIAIQAMATRNTSVQIMAQEDAHLDVAYEWIRKLLPPQSPKPPETDLRINFWNNTRDGAISRSRRVTVPTWTEIALNYPKEVRHSLDPLMRKFTPSTGGQLILWHGPPGTGKTYAIRAMAREWRKWAQPEYIVDPEQFFGRDSGYLLDVLLRETAEPEWNPETLDYEMSHPDNWKLIILEDAGEFLAADARDKTAQGFSRLLNTVDGLIGQGLQVLVLITTNENLASLHPAVTRPGRCISNIEFPYLSSDEASQWLKHHDKEGETSEKVALAELYARL